MKSKVKVKQKQQLQSTKNNTSETTNKANTQTTIHGTQKTNQKQIPITQNQIQSPTIIQPNK